MGMTKLKSFSQREGALLGYSPQQSSLGSTPRSPYRNPDVDFDDVFGGPPRRSSMPEIRQSFSAVNGDHEAWSGLSENPVFGSSPSRRRYPSHDFFNDIFRGDESVTSTPREQEREPGSWVLSPAHPLPPKAEPFASSSIFPQFSLTPKLSRGMGLPTFGSSSRSLNKSKDGASNGIPSPGIAPSRFSSQAIHGIEDMKNDTRLPYGQSLLSQELSLSNKEFLNLSESDKIDAKGNSEKESESKEDSTGSRFHFSIYKWASKGAPWEIPIRGGNNSRLKERVKTEQLSRSNGIVDDESMARGSSKPAVHDASSNDLLFLDAKSSRFEHCKPENDLHLIELSLDEEIKCQSSEEALGSERLSSLQSAVKGDPCYNILCDTNEHMKSSSTLERGLHGKIEKKIYVSTEDAQKTKLKPLHSLFSDDDFEQGSDEVAKIGIKEESIAQNTENSSAVVDDGETVKKQDGKGTSFVSSVVNKSSLQSSPMKSKENQGRTKVKGKVKEFVKFFNQETSPKTKVGFRYQRQNSKQKEKSTSVGGNEESTSNIKTDEKRQTTDVNNKLPDASIMKDEELKRSAKGHASVKTASYIFNKTFGIDSSASNTGSSPHDSKAAVGETDESFHGNFQIKELPLGENELPRASNNDEEIRAIDAKIRQWKKGKEGNIRSLLSTLQFVHGMQVLWAESGWKPVPLVDIIEGNSVKRAYQRALLCLHPDKLQQKGAASHQKYMAEKVFDCLQEAWDYFNSLGSVE
ncbi:J domain-containing protein required for chloroplast accumulation response 1 isoform X1 [Ziziphus jujuba]|uniref:J domain-containing protein required for chloroplast accumulation response 1 isoform X1 n=1 Tax=Ziziphus jujuba TaxID=326968 RepID=A0ABM3IMZ7_ZIZJJ|nr:J domain-containing protein required for chloroplast accumulation response 1 isoform X1 [Ziziphus jujuba]